MDEDIFGNEHEGEDVESTVDVMKDYLEEESSSSSEARDIFDECHSDSNDTPEKPNRKKFVWGTHIKIISEKPPTCYHCTICDSYFSHRNTARNHKFCDTGQKPYKCNLCDKRFVNKSDRNNHRRTHSGDRPFECSICDKTFYLKHKLSRHIRSHTGVKGEFKCSKCQRPFICKEALRKHEVSQHTSKKVTECKTCKKVFENNRELSKHKCSKKNKKKLVCEICGKTFSKNWNLTVHLRIHEGQRPYECTDCQKSFRLRQHLERHSAKHQSDADFECTLCNQTFGRKDNMIRHLKLTHPDRHLGVHLDEIVKRAEKLKKDKTKKTVVEKPAVHSEMEPPAVPTIVTIDNLPNIRFAKMPPTHAKSKAIQKVPTEVSESNIVGGESNMKPSELRESVNSSEPSVDSAGRESIVYESRTVKSVVLTTVIQSGRNQIVRQTATRVWQQSSVICPTDSSTAANRSDWDQPRCSVPHSHKSKSNVVQSINCNQEAATDLLNHSSDVRDSPKRYLPVSVLCFKSSSELRTAVPKNITSNS